MSKITYDEGVQLLILEIEPIKRERKLKSFCLENDISYEALISVLNLKSIPLPKLVQAALAALGYKVSNNKEIFFIIEPKAKLTSP